MQNLRARYYAPQQGRFVTRDPFPGMLGLPATLNPYSYVVNNPVMYTDPSGEIAPILVIAGMGFVAGAIIDAYQQTNGFTNFCHYEILQTLAWGAGGAAAATSFTIMAVSGVGLLGMGLQGAALGLSGIGISGSISTSIFIAGTSAVGWSSTAMALLFIQRPSPQQFQQPTSLNPKQLPAKAGPVANISPSEVINRTPNEINDRAVQLGLEPKGPNPMGGEGAYVDPQTGVQRILIHPDSPPYPHGHINNAMGLRIDIFGNIAHPNSPDKHFWLRR